MFTHLTSRHVIKEPIISVTMREQLCLNLTKHFFLGYHNRMNNRIHCNHPNIWRFIQFMQLKEKQFGTVVTHRSTSASRTKDARVIARENLINIPYERFHNGHIDAFELLASLSYQVGSNTKKNTRWRTILVFFDFLCIQLLQNFLLQNS